jgi:hypothetical protein
MPKALFNIAYTLPSAPSYMKGNARAEYQARRSFYDLTAQYNFFSYVLNGKKIARNANAEEYYTRGGTNGGLFNLDGAMSEGQVAEMKKRLESSKSVIWHGFISFDEETSRGFQTQENAVKFMRQTFGSFLERTHLNPKNIELYAALHLDKEHHHHIHFAFFEREPKHRDKNGVLGYTHRGKFDARAIDNYLVSANMHLSENGYEYYTARDRAMSRLRETRKEIGNSVKNADLRLALSDLRSKLPKERRLQYNAAQMKELRPDIDRVAELLIASDPAANAAHKEMLVQLARVKEEVIELVKDNKLAYSDDRRMSKQELAAAMSGDSSMSLKFVDLKNVDYFERLQADYRARVGNVVLGVCKDLSRNDYQDRCRKHNINDRSMKINAKHRWRRRESLLQNAVRILAEVDKQQPANFIKTVQEIEREQEMERRIRA